MINNSAPTNTSYIHENDNRLLTAGGATFGYDDNGNLITKTLGGTVTNYSLEYNDMLTRVSSIVNTYVYRYDGVDRVARIVKLEGNSNLRFAWGGNLGIKRLENDFMVRDGGLKDEVKVQIMG